MTTNPDRWVLTFIPAPGFTAPMAVRVRRLLKCSLRAFGLRCVDLGGPDRAVSECQCDQCQRRRVSDR